MCVMDCVGQSMPCEQIMTIWGTHCKWSDLAVFKILRAGVSKIAVCSDRAVMPV